MTPRARKDQTTAEIILSTKVTGSQRSTDLPSFDGMKKSNIGHQANIDVADEDEAISQVDYLDQSQTQEDIKRGKEANKEFFYEQFKAQKSEPFTKIIPTKRAPIKSVLEKQASVYQKPIQAADGHAKIRNVFGEKSKAEDLKKQIGDAMMDEAKEEETKRNADTTIEKSILESSTKLNMLCQSLLEKKITVDEARIQFNSMYFAPENITLLAMSHVVLSKNFKTNDPIYNLLSRAFVDEKAVRLGFLNSDDFLLSIEKAHFLKDIKKFKKISLDDEMIQKRLIDEALELNEVIASSKSKFKGKYSIVDRRNPAGSVQGKPTEDDILKYNVVESNVESKHLLYTFRYDLKFTYSVLFYIYYYHFNGILPFGKTLPSLSYLLILSFLLDPYNNYSLRYDPDEYILKMGGIGLLQKTNFQKEMPEFTLSSIFKPFLGGNGDAKTVKGIIVSFLVTKMRLELRRKKLDQLHDSITRNFNELKGLLAHQETNKLEYPQHSETIFKDYFENMEAAKVCVEDGVVINKFVRAIANKYDFEFYERDSSPADIHIYFSYEAYLISDNLIKLSKRFLEGDSSSKVKLVSMLMDEKTQTNKVFALIKSALSNEAFHGICISLFKSQENFAMVRTAVDTAESFLKTASPSEIGRLLSEVDYDRFNVNWVNEITKVTEQKDPFMAVKVRELIGEGGHFSDHFYKDRSNIQKRTPSSNQHLNLDNLDATFEAYMMTHKISELLTDLKIALKGKTGIEKATKKKNIMLAVLRYYSFDIYKSYIATGDINYNNIKKYLVDNTGLADRNANYRKAVYTLAKIELL